MRDPWVDIALTFTENPKLQWRTGDYNLEAIFDALVDTLIKHGTIDIAAAMKAKDKDGE